jgi:hypothetical protein
VTMQLLAAPDGVVDEWHASVAVMIGSSQNWRCCWPSTHLA